MLILTQVQFAVDGASITQNAPNILFWNVPHILFRFVSFVDVVLHRSEKCCGGTKMDSATHVCCPQIFEHREHVIEKEMNNHTDCCPSPQGGNSYSKLESFCSNGGKVMQKYSNKTFCGVEEYNMDKDLCCNNMMHRNARTKGLRCCNPGYATYDPKKQVCCNSVPTNGHR